MFRCYNLALYTSNSLKNKFKNHLNRHTIALISTKKDDKPAVLNADEKKNQNLIEVTIDGKKIMVEKGITMLEAAALAGVEIPRFCYHERLSIAGNCRMCLVEVEKSVKPVASCAMPVMMPNTVIKTNSDFAKKAREGVMEFLLKNHPLDCPICDQGGECDLQDQSMAFGSDKSRFQIKLDAKRSVEDKDIGTLVKTIMTRCIHCTRCVRFMNEIAGFDNFGTTGRGEQMQIGTYLENTVLLSELSSNIVDLCPVGALTSKPYSFTARPWELRRVDSIDVLDAVGSNIVVCTRAGDLLRILPRLNEDINEEWLPDKSRHAPIDGLKNQRITVPMLRPSRNSSLQQCDWEDLLIILSNAISNASSINPNSLSAVVGPTTDAETMVALKDLFNKLGSENLYYHVDSSFDSSAFPSEKDVDFRGNYLFNTTISGLEDGVDFVLLVGTNLRFEAPMVNARLRKLWKTNLLNDIVSIGPKDLDLLYDYEWLGDQTSILNDILNGKNKIVKKIKNAKKPILILGQQILKGSRESNIYTLANQVAAKYNIEFNLLHSNASSVAALDLGFKPSSSLKFLEDENDAVLWLFNVDDENLKIPSNYFAIYQGHNGDDCVNKVDLVIPSSAYTEKQAIYCNMEGRTQQTLKAISPPVLARDDWKVIRACSELVNCTLSYDNLKQIRNRLYELSPNLSSPNSNYIQKASKLIKLTNNLNTLTSTKIDTKLKKLVDYFQTDSISRSSLTMAKCVVSVQKASEDKRFTLKN